MVDGRDALEVDLAEQTEGRLMAPCLTGLASGTVVHLKGSVCEHVAARYRDLFLEGR